MILEVTLCNVGVPFRVSLLPSHHGKGNLTLGIFRCFGKVVIMSNIISLLTFEFFCAVFHYLVLAGTCLGLGYT